jgi:hypothetical protein
VNYTYLTLAQARTLLASRMGDPNNIHWIPDELSVALVESLRTFQAYTGYWRGRASFVTSGGNAWYDLTTVLNPALRSYNVTDRQLAASLVYTLTENANAVATGLAVSTDQFSFTQLVQALQRRRNQFLEATGTVLTRYAGFPITPANQARYGLPSDSIIDVRRVAWVDATTGAKTVLWRQDAFQSGAFNPGWAAQSATPQVYEIAVEPPLTIGFDVLPPAGRIDLVTVNAGGDLNPATPVLAGVPDDWSWLLKWGALATLLSQDGEAPDPMRAAYAQARWEQGLALARLAPSVLTCQINGVDIMPTSVSDFDSYSVGWENVSATTQNSVSNLLLEGLNLVALSPVPAAASAVVVLDVVQNAPVPVLDSDLIQIGREELEAVLGYAQTLLAFKTGGKDFEDTVPLYEAFLKQAVLFTDRLAAFSPSAVTFALAAHTECERVLRRKSDALQRPATLAPVGT